MNRSLLVGLVLLTLPVALYSQKSRVFSVIQLIESGKYTEAKEAIELAVWNDKTSRWSRTYYAKGLLCQKAYEQGIEKNDEKLTSLYPDQLIVAHSSYEKALELGPGNRIRSAISVHYYSLANLFKSQGSAYYRNKQYSKALKAFEHALLVNNSSVIESSMDTSLVFNTALAAFESRNWEKAISYLTGLNDDGYSPESAILLYRSYMHQGDSIEAEMVLKEAIGYYESDEDLVMQLVDHLVDDHRLEEAIEILSEAGIRHPDHSVFPWTRGLLYEKLERNEEAIQSLLLALELSPEEPGILYGLGICHFNLGVSYEENARNISNRIAYQQVREEARKQFLIAIDYLEKTKSLNPEYRGVSSRLALLHQYLQLEQ
jgi:tetratricopeptide (TPR) repeat protein